MACHAFDTKWHARCNWPPSSSRKTCTSVPRLKAGLPLAPSLDYCTSVPRHAAHVARPCICALFKLGVPRLGSQVARPSDFLELACHAFDTKWHTIVEHATPSPWRATSICMLGLLLWTFSAGVPRLAPSVPRECIFVTFAPSGTPVSHTQLLEMEASVKICIKDGTIKGGRSFKLMDNPLGNNLLWFLIAPPYTYEPYPQHSPQLYSQAPFHQTPPYDPNPYPPYQPPFEPYEPHIEPQPFQPQYLQEPPSPYYYQDEPPPMHETFHPQDEFYYPPQPSMGEYPYPAIQGQYDPTYVSNLEQESRDRLEESIDRLQETIQQKLDSWDP
ncbi:hypothetical protein AHAS_Ahas09G0143800 [Arachis hypogaea]